MLDLQPLLDERLRGSFSAVLADTIASILLTDGKRSGWVIEVEHGRLTSHPAGAQEVTTTVTAPIEVLAGVVRGEISGIEAFLDGQLTMRGNMALALQLDGLFVPDESVARTRARVVRAGGVETFYLEAGPVDATTVVLVHGLGATNASMLPLLHLLAPSYHVLAPDLPGHGGSGHVRDTYAAEFLGRWLLAFVAQMSDQPPVLVGNSLGGRTVLEAAMLDPDAVGGLVLLCPAVAFRRLRQFVPVVRLLRPELSALPWRMPRRLIMLGMRQLLADPARLSDAWYQSATDEFIRVMQRPGGRRAFFASARQAYLEEPFGVTGFWDRLRSLGPPALFVWGDRDILVPPGFARHAAEAVPAARNVVLENCGHVPQFEHPQATADLVIEFVEGLSGDNPRVSRVRKIAATG